MKRTAFLRSAPFPKASSSSLRPKRCDARKGGCGNQFTPTRPMQKACGPSCALAMGRIAAAKQEAKLQAEDKRQTRKQLEAMKTLPTLKKEAQAAFNAWIRKRDAAQPCISCGAPPPDLSKLHAGRDAGHYRSTGSADNLRFHEDNCHAQCVKCNQWGAGMAVDYRIGLINRIGTARVEELERNNTVHKWTREEVRGIRDEYRRKAREMEKK